jgi:hypothetical protein
LNAQYTGIASGTRGAGQQAIVPPFSLQEKSMSFPTSFAPPLVRTDFSDEAAWQAIRAAILTVPPELAGAMGMMNFMNAGDEDNEDSDDDEDDEAELDAPWFVNIIDDPRFADLSTENVLAQLPSEGTNACLFIVDRQTMSDPDHPILVVDLLEGGSRTFRTIPAQVWAIGSNLPIANMGWEDFAEHVDEQGVFRGHE